MNVLRETRQRLVKKTPIGDDGPPFNPKHVPTYPEPRKPKSGMNMPKIPSWIWILLVLVIIPMLCCCCCLYFCCCRKKKNSNPRRQNPSDLTETGDYVPTAPSSGGMKGFLGGLGGAAIGNTISNIFNRNARAPVPNSVPQTDGGFYDPPAYNPTAPIQKKIDEGGGGEW